MSLSIIIVAKGLKVSVQLHRLSQRHCLLVQYSLYRKETVYSTPCVMFKEVSVLYHITIETPNRNEKEKKR